MARFNLSTDILSPINSAVSLTNISDFSLGSFSGTPDYDKDIESPVFKSAEKDSDINLLCAKTMEESTNAFEVVTNNIKKQANINAEREERAKTSYERFRKSIDDVFYSKMVDLPNSSPKIKNILSASKADCRKNTIKSLSDSQKLKDNKEATDTPENNLKVSNKKLEKNQKESSALNKEKKTHRFKNAPTAKESVDTSKVKNKVKIKTGTDSKKNIPLDGSKPENSDAAPLATQASKSLEAKGLKSKRSTEKTNAKGAGNVKDFKFKTERKIPITHDVQTNEQKSLSIEKSIQVAVGMEMDNLRNFMLDHNTSIRKELLKLQEMAKKQAKVTEDLFSVIDELLEANKKLVYKH